MNSKLKSEIKDVKDNILDSTRFLDKTVPLTDKEKWFITDTLIKSNNLIEKLKKEVNKNAKED